jgi:hypothetical protein
MSCGKARPGEGNILSDFAAVLLHNLVQNEAAILTVSD